MQAKPKYKHDCPRCRFLGVHETQDLYVCDEGPARTVKVRFSGGPRDYIAYPIAVLRAQVPWMKRGPFVEAYNRVKKNGGFY